MIELTPRYIEALDPDHDRTKVLLRKLGLTDDDVRAAASGAAVHIHRPQNATRAQTLLTQQLVDLLLRLQPLVRSVTVVDDHSFADDLSTRFPLECRETESPSSSDVAVSIGVRTGSEDIVADAAGWVATLGGRCTAEDDGINPIGAFAAAALCAGDVFKLLVRRKCPDARLARQAQLNAGSFSFWDYTYDGDSPRLPSIHIDAVVVGCGGVGSGVLTTLGAFGGAIEGELRLVDHDEIDMYTLNRVTYADTDGAVRKDRKVQVARAYLSRRVPNLKVVPVDRLYAEFKRGWSRKDRRFPLVLAGLDSDDARVEVQMDLPRRLVDGSTGAYLNCVVESVNFGGSGCIGCSRIPFAPPAQGVECDVAPERTAPSISFLSAFAGTLVAAEAIKLTLGHEHRSFGRFEHVFTYGLNGDLRSQVSPTPTCQVRCADETVRKDFDSKWKQ